MPTCDLKAWVVLENMYMWTKKKLMWLHRFSLYFKPKVFRVLLYWLLRMFGLNVWNLQTLQTSLCHIKHPAARLQLLQRAASFWLCSHVKMQFAWKTGWGSCILLCSYGSLQHRLTTWGCKATCTLSKSCRAAEARSICQTKINFMTLMNKNNGKVEKNQVQNIKRCWH